MADVRLTDEERSKDDWYSYLNKRLELILQSLLETDEIQTLIKNAISELDVTDFATKESLDDYATIDSLSDYALISSLGDYAKKTDVDNAISTAVQSGHIPSMPKADMAIEMQPSTLATSSDDDGGWLYYKNPVSGDVVGVAGQNTVSQLRTQQISDHNTIIEIQAHIDNKTLGTTIDIEDTQGVAATGGYTVTNALGGVIEYVGLNVLLTTWAVFVNGKTVDNGQLLGLVPSPPIKMEVKNEDVITSIGLQSITFTPYI